MNPSKQRRLIGVLAIVVVFLAALAATAFWALRTYITPRKQIIVLNDVPAPITDAPPGSPAPLATAVGGVIGGTVLNEDGNPVSGARISFSWRAPAPPNALNGAANPFSTGSARSDAQGHWTYAGIPDNALASMTFTVTQKDYVAANPLRAPARQLRDRSAVFTLSRGVDITGTVVDAAGAPVAGAQVALGRNQRAGNSAARSDKDGKFTLHHVLASTTVMVTAMHDGLAPAAQQVRTGQTVDPIRLVMTAGRTLTGRVTDKSGNPISGVSVAINQWNGNFMGGISRVTTDGHGVYTMNDLPTDMVQMEAFKQGYVGDLEQVEAGLTHRDFTVSPELTISGSVVDAVTHQPIERFTLEIGAKWTGSDTPNFNGGGPAFSNGHYQQTLNGFIGNIDGWYVRISAKGYLPATSPELEASGVQDFALQPGKDLQGRVLTADGKPAAGASIGVALPGQNLFVSDGQVQNQRGAAILTDAQGRFDLPPQSGNFIVVAAGADGFAQADQDELAKSADLRLSEWGAIEGTALIGGKPAVDQQINGYPADRIFDPRMPMVQFGYSGQTDGQGHFSLDRVVPGDVMVSRLAQAPGQNFLQNVATENVTVEAGKTATVTLGASGRTVSGSVELPPEASGWTNYSISADLHMIVKLPPNPMPADMAKKTPQEQQNWWNDFYLTDAGKAYRKAQRAARNYNQDIGADGKFTFDAVVPGDYQLTIRPYPRSGGQALAFGQTQLTVPPLAAGGDDQPIQVPAIKLIVNRQLNVGDSAPDLHAAAPDGRDVKLVDYSGKYVLLEISDSIPSDSDSEDAHLKAVAAAFATDARLVIFTVSVYGGAATSQPSATNGSAWISATISPDSTTAAEIRSWSIHHMPAIFLIGPDGKLIARDLTGDAIMAAVQTALKPAP